MGPEPIFRSPTDGLLEETEILFCDVPIGNVFGIFEHRDDVNIVVSTSRTGDVEIDTREVKLLSDDLSACDDDGVLVVEEVGPVASGRIEWHLVADETEYDRFIGFAFGDDATQNDLHGYAFSPHATTDVEQEGVEGFVAEDMVDLTSKHMGRKMKSDARDPFPIAVMSDVESHVVSLVEIVVNMLQTVEMHSSLYLGVGD